MAKKTQIEQPETNAPDLEDRIESEPTSEPFIITAPPEQVSEAPAPEIIPAPEDEIPASHLGEWPTEEGQLVVSDAFEGRGVVMSINELTANVQFDDGRDPLFIAVSELGVVVEG